MMRLITIVFLLFCSVWTTNLFAQTDELEMFIQEQINENQIPGLAALVVKEGEICWEGYFGMANIAEGRQVDASTIFMLASVSKTMTATAAMKLHEEGHFELDDDANLYLPAPFQVTIPGYPSSPITFRQLLNHYSSIKDNWSLMPYSDGDPTTPLGDFLFNYLDKAGADYDSSNNFYSVAPGTEYHYSNIGVALLGYLVEVISGQPFNEYCNTKIFSPMEMNDTGWFLSEIDQSRLAMPYWYDSGAAEHVEIGHYGYSDYPDGQLRSTPRDLANYLNTYMNDGVLAETETEVLDASTVQLLTPVDFSMGLTWNLNYISGYPIWAHNGGDQGVRTDIGFNPQDDIGVILLTNGEAALGGIWTSIWDFARSEGCEAVSTSLDEADSHIDISITPNPNNGVFNITWGQAGFETLSLFSSDGRLMKTAFIENQRTIEWITPLPPGTYYLKLQGGKEVVVNPILILD